MKAGQREAVRAAHERFCLLGAPAVPGPDSHCVLQVAHIASSRSRTLCAQSHSNENISPAVVMKVAKELRGLSSEPLDGIKVALNEDDVTDICADIRGPGPGAGAHPCHDGDKACLGSC